MQKRQRFVGLKDGFKESTVESALNSPLPLLYMALYLNIDTDSLREGEVQFRFKEGSVTGKVNQIKNGTVVRVLVKDALVDPRFESVWKEKDVYRGIVVDDGHDVIELPVAFALNKQPAGEIEVVLHTDGIRNPRNTTTVLSIHALMLEAKTSGHSLHMSQIETKSWTLNAFCYGCEEFGKPGGCLAQGKTRAEIVASRFCPDALLVSRDKTTLLTKDLVLYIKPPVKHPSFVFRSPVELKYCATPDSFSTALNDLVCVSCTTWGGIDNHLSYGFINLAPVHPTTLTSMKSFHLHKYSDSTGASEIPHLFGTPFFTPTPSIPPSSLTWMAGMNALPAFVTTHDLPPLIKVTRTANYACSKPKAMVGKRSSYTFFFWNPKSYMCLPLEPEHTRVHNNKFSLFCELVLGDPSGPNSGVRKLYDALFELWETKDDRSLRDFHIPGAPYIKKDICREMVQEAEQHRESLIGFLKPSAFEFVIFKSKDRYIGDGWYSQRGSTIPSSWLPRDLPDGTGIVVFLNEGHYGTPGEDWMWASDKMKAGLFAVNVSQKTFDVLVHEDVNVLPKESILESGEWTEAAIRKICHHNSWNRLVCIATCPTHPEELGSSEIVVFGNRQSILSGLVWTALTGDVKPDEDFELKVDEHGHVRQVIFTDDGSKVDYIWKDGVSMPLPPSVDGRATTIQSLFKTDDARSLQSLHYHFPHQVEQQLKDAIKKEKECPKCVVLKPKVRWFASNEGVFGKEILWQKQILPHNIQKWKHLKTKRVRSEPPRDDSPDDS